MQEELFSQLLSKFTFQEDKVGFIGVERERFLVNRTMPVPRSVDFLTAIDDARWTYELSACQVEDRTPPCETISQLREAMLENDSAGQTVAQKIGLTLQAIEVAGKNMSLDIYPEPRYLQIVKSITHERLSAACRVAGTHIHLGAYSLQDAVNIYNILLGHLDDFCAWGDHSKGQRLELYKTMAIDWEPPRYNNVQHFFDVARERGFDNNPRNCWHLIRISIHGTVELRMFGVTEDVNEICGWVKEVKRYLP